MGGSKWDDKRVEHRLFHDTRDSSISCKVMYSISDMRRGASLLRVVGGVASQGSMTSKRRFEGWNHWNNSSTFTVH